MTGVGVNAPGLVTRVHPYYHFTILCSDGLAVTPLLSVVATMCECMEHEKRGVTIEIYVAGKRFTYTRDSIPALKKELTAALEGGK